MNMFGTKHPDPKRTLAVLRIDPVIFCSQMTQSSIPQSNEFQTNNFLHFIGSKNIKVNRLSFNKKHLLTCNINNDHIRSLFPNHNKTHLSCVFLLLLASFRRNWCDSWVRPNWDNPRSVRWLRRPSWLACKSIPRLKSFGKTWSLQSTNGYPPVNKHSNGKSPSWIGNTSSNGGFSIAMLDYRSVIVGVCFKGTS